MINLLDDLNNDLWNEKGVVYCYTNKINNRKYVGQTNQKLIKRHKAHLRASGGKNTEYDNNTPIHRAIAKYGINNFKLEILAMNCTDYNLLNEYEIFFIKRFKSLTSENGYNISDGGHNGNCFAGKNEEEMNEIKRKIRDSLKGENNPCYGKKYTTEEKEKLRESNDTKRTVIGINLKTKEILKYDSIKQCVCDGFSDSIVYQCALQNEIGEDEFYKLYKRHRPQHKGYKWFFESDFNDNIDFKCTKKYSVEGKEKLKGCQKGKEKKSSKKIIAINLKSFEKFYFNSLIDCENQLKEITGIEFKKGSICAVCSYHRDNTKRRKLSYNSFSFYYLDDYSDEKLIKEIKEFNL